MIPKVIHYVWFGGKPLTPLAERCIASWKRYMPDYEIRRWDETTFDVNQSDYIREAYSCGQWAFASDFARFRIIYDYGGVYLDTDVELIQSLEPILERGPFMACDKWSGTTQYPNVATGLGFAAESQNKIIETILERYLTMHFDGGYSGETVVTCVTDILKTVGLRPIDSIQNVGGISIYPKVYFCPFDYMNRLDIRPETVAIHHYAGSWISQRNLIKRKIAEVLGHRVTHWIIKIKGLLRRSIK